MGRTKQNGPTNKGILSASEIGQYHYCSMAWYLQRLGHKPDSPWLTVGSKKHEKYGQVLDNVKSTDKNSKNLAIAGYVLFIVACFVLLFGVIL